MRSNKGRRSINSGIQFSFEFSQAQDDIDVRRISTSNNIYSIENKLNKKNSNTNSIAIEKLISHAESLNW